MNQPSNYEKNRLTRDKHQKTDNQQNKQHVRLFNSDMLLIPLINKDLQSIYQGGVMRKYLIYKCLDINIINISL